MSYWPKQVVEVLHKRMGFTHELVNMPDNEIGKFLQRKMMNVPLERFIGMTA
jgi:hypothetical protein